GHWGCDLLRCLATRLDTPLSLHHISLGCRSPEHLNRIPCRRSLARMARADQASQRCSGFLRSGDVYRVRCRRYSYILPVYSEMKIKPKQGMALILVNAVNSADADLASFTSAAGSTGFLVGACRACRNE